MMIDKKRIITCSCEIVLINNPMSCYGPNPTQEEVNQQLQFLIDGERYEEAQELVDWNKQRKQDD